MDTGTILFTSIVLLAFIIPITILNRNRIKRKHKLIKLLIDRAAQEGCTISEHHTWHNMTIAFDRTTRQLFFLRTSGEGEEIVHVNLKEMQKCRVVNSSRNIKGKGSNYVVTDRIELAFTPVVAGNQETMLCLYNSKYDSMTLQGELQLAEKWSEIANSVIEGK